MAIPIVANSPRWPERLRRDPPSPDAGSLFSLFAPLDRLLVTGGDARLDLVAGERRNKYGCRPAPHPEAISFSSCTATSISARGFAAAERARRSLLEHAIAHGLADAFDAHTECLRDRLRACFGLEKSGAEIVFAASGTDAQLQALYLAKALLGSPLATIVVGSDQTGRGTAYTSNGRHFGTRTNRGDPVHPGTPIDDLSDGVTSIGIPLDGEDGLPLAASEVDRRVEDAVARFIAAGSNVLLQTMDCSKLGRRGPSDECTQRIAARWLDRLCVVVDACQMRTTRARLAHHLASGFIVLGTGSKFFAGPPFSGALFVPARFTSALAVANPFPGGLAAYASAHDWPRRWSSLRAGFPTFQNFGQWLRWEAAVAEIEAYFAVPPGFRREALKRFSAVAKEALRGAPHVEPLCDGDGRNSDESIAAFLIRAPSGYLSLKQVDALYAALAGDAPALLRSGPERATSLVSQVFLPGQPVPLSMHGEMTAALRIAASARLASDAWCRDEANAHTNLERALEGVDALIAKIELLLPYIAGDEPLRA